MRRKKVKRYEPEALDFQTRLIANGGTIQEDTLDAVTAFVTSCKTAGIWNKFTEVGPFVGDQLAGALVKLKYFAAGVLVNQNFVGGDYTERGANGGLLGNGATKYLKTGIVPDDLGITLASASFYLRTVTPAGLSYLLGAGPGGSLNGLRYVSANFYEFQWNSGDPASGSNAQFLGLAAGSRLAGNDLRVFINGVQRAQDNAVQADYLNSAGEIFLFEDQNAGAPIGSKLNGRCSFYSVGQALSGTEQASLYAAVQALQLALGRAV